MLALSTLSIGNDVPQKEHGLLIEVHDRAGLFAMAPGPLAY
jgi:hypothetical protein